jgi:hypothetical protein
LSPRGQHLEEFCQWEPWGRPMSRGFWRGTKNARKRQRNLWIDALLFTCPIFSPSILDCPKIDSTPPPNLRRQPL